MELSVDPGARWSYPLNPGNPGAPDGLSYPLDPGDPMV